MAYVGKFFDRNPNVRAAGLTYPQTGTASDTMKIYSSEEAAENIILAKYLHQTKLKRQDLLPYCRYIPEENVKDVLSPELKKSRFVAFREKFSENMYFKKPELGKVFPLDSKPGHITNESTTFGDPSYRSDPIYELILPRKTPEEVNRQFIEWHDKYVLSHKHYFPSEQICRHYDKPFNKFSSFGIVYNVDFNGKYVKRTMSQCDNLIVISKSQKEYLERTLGRLGKNTNRHNPNITDDTSFGVTSTVDKCNVKSLLENMEPCEQTSPLVVAIGHLNKLRHRLFKRRDFYMIDLKLALEQRDINKTGYLTLNQIFRTLRTELVYVNEEKVKTALRHFKMITDEGLETERVNYEDLWKLLHMQLPLPKTGNVSKMPPNIYNKDTTYRLLCSDRAKKPNESPAPKPLYPPYKEEPTTVKDVVAPDIPMHFGLGPSDFEMPRSKDELRRIFKRVLTDKFDVIWDIARNDSKRPNDFITVDELRLAMNRKRETGIHQ